uniref:Uncharacterized protein n=1 Tax=Molossus molossus TaxID=27622 RepID=A0A7J8EEI2_MOLMO|nr:hypothetical protein HJG59_008866 [Molossus molossus]
MKNPPRPPAGGSSGRGEPGVPSALEVAGSARLSGSSSLFLVSQSLFLTRRGSGGDGIASLGWKLQDSHLGGFRLGPWTPRPGTCSGKDYCWALADTFRYFSCTEFRVISFLGSPKDEVPLFHYKHPKYSGIPRSPP